MSSDKNHPGRSHNFLSRLHDGDLTPAERAHFEAHRAHCKECRSAAADFERALSLFRSSRSSPPPADLANRVLRKVQAAGVSRRTPFGDLFSVDLRWAGAFAVALLVLLVAAPVVLRQEPRAPAASDAPISVALQGRENRQKSDSAPVSAPAPVANHQTSPYQEAERNAQAFRTEPDLAKKASDPSLKFANEPKTLADDKATGKIGAVEEGAAKPAPEAKLEAAQAAAPAAPSSTMARRVGAPPAKVQAPMAQAAAPPSEAQGGEGARDQVTLSAGSPVLDRPARIVVQAFDALGTPPELQARPLDPVWNDLRGHSFVIQVDEQGRVLEARESASKNLVENQKRRRDEDLSKEKDSAVSGPAQETLKSLRFKPTERKRRLLVRVE